ncbi:MAG TPA: phosphatase PAP2 family protein [Alphaproteobacteria bacterium]|nr:phosphatase PAP2 family protein [Alphaproteobacteria bacterium]
MDLTITRWLNAPAGSNAALDLIMAAASNFGVPLLVLVVVVQWWSREKRPYVRHTCVTAGLAFLIGLGLNQLILLFVHRIRPYDAGATHLIIGPSSDWSFPSDHATATLAIAATFLLHGFRRRGLALLIGALLICVSRVYVGIHYASDVAGGMVTGIAAAIGVSALYLEGTKMDRLITRIL